MTAGRVEGLKDMGGMGGHTIVCGLDRLGYRVADALIRLGEQVTIVTDQPDPALMKAVQKAGARIVHGRAVDVAGLPGVNLAGAGCLVLTDEQDLGNLQAALSARDASPDLRIVIRMFSADLAHRATRLLSNARTISSSYEAAPYFAAAALGEGLPPSRLVWGRRLASDAGDDQDAVTPVRVNRRRARLRLASRAVLAFFDRRLAVTAVAVTLLMATTTVLFHTFGRMSWVDALFNAGATSTGNFPPQSPPWLKVYDVGFMFATAAALAMLFALVTDALLGTRILEALGVPRGRMRDHVIVIGLGSVGYRITQHLLGAGVEVAAAEINERNHWIQLARRQGIPVLVADGRYRDSLRLLSADAASAVIAATDDDLANLEASLIGRELNPEARIVARLFDPELADRAERQLGIDACFSATALASPAFVAAAIGDGVLGTLERDQRLWLLAEIEVEGPHADVPSFEAPPDLRVLAVRTPSGVYWAPDVPDRLARGDAVLLVCTREGWERARLMRGPSPKA